jgi:Carboxypeptidase regulatory-like domain
MKGRVVDENDAPVRAARVAVRTGSAAAAWQAQTDLTGAFAIALPGPGDFLVSVEREGYYALVDRAVHVEGAQEVTLAINGVREVFQSQNVNEETSPLEVAGSANRDRLTGTEINNIPYANSHSLKSAAPLMPDVVQDAAGNLHVNGSSENQVLYTLNGFNLTDPISGQFETVLAVEGIRSMELSSGRYSPEFGKGSAGVLAINTENGTDRFHYTATDFVPGLRIQNGVQLANWYPRFGLSGPIVRGRAWFSDTFASEFTESLITGLPSGQNTRTGWLGSNLLHAQVKLTQSNTLFADFLVNANSQGRVGLAPLNPVSTTFSLHGHQYFGSVKDQVYFGHGVLVEFGYAHNDFSSTQTPQGEGLYVISPDGNSGYSFVNSTETSSRDQGLIHAYLPQFHFAGEHQIEAGTDDDVLRYEGDFQRTGYQVYGLSGQLISQTVFPIPAHFHTSDTEVSSWVFDNWHMSSRFQLQFGLRQDWDRSIESLAWSPHAGFSWSPFASSHTTISGGYAITHDAVTMEMLGRPLDQVAFTTQYNPDGTVAGPPASTSFAIHPPLALPLAINWNVNVDHQLPHRVYLKAKYLRRRGNDGFAFVDTAAPGAPPSLLPVPGGTAAGVYQLTNLRRDDYDSVQVSVRQMFSGQYEWMAAYTYSRALTNVVIDPYSLQPLQVLPNLVPMPWDAPNRFLAWAYLPLPRKNWAVSILANMRTGFPYSVRDQSGVVVGAVNEYRYPLDFDLNLAIERTISLHGYRFALRGGVDNLTNQENPTAVYNVIGAPHFRQFLGDEGRHFVARIRFFGRAQK